MRQPRETKRPQHSDKPGSATSDLAARIARARADNSDEEPASQATTREMTGLGRGFRLASEFVAAIIVGAGLGLGVDYLFGTTPWGMIVLLLLGFAAGVLNVIRAAAAMNAANAKLPVPPAVNDDEDD